MFRKLESSRNLTEAREIQGKQFLVRGIEMDVIAFRCTLRHKFACVVSISVDLADNFL